MRVEQAAARQHREDQARAAASASAASCSIPVRAMKDSGRLAQASSVQAMGPLSASTASAQPIFPTSAQAGRRCAWRTKSSSAAATGAGVAASACQPARPPLVVQPAISRSISATASQRGSGGVPSSAPRIAPPPGRPAGRRAGGRRGVDSVRSALMLAPPGTAKTAARRRPPANCSSDEPRGRTCIPLVS